MVRFYLKGDKRTPSMDVKILAEKVGADWFNDDGDGDWEIILVAPFKEGDSRPALKIDNEKDVYIGWADGDEDFEDGHLHSKRSMVWASEQIAKLAFLVPRQNKEEKE